MPTEAQKPLHLFYCYARKDKAFRDELDNHLTPLRRRNLISTWSDLEIIPGTKWQEKIIARLDAAHIILLLVSSDFMASDYCYSVEMERALERHNAGTVRVVPIILRPIDWHDAPFSSLQVLPTDAKPVSTWPDRDAAFYDITQGIRMVVAELRILLEIQEWSDQGKEFYQLGKYEEAIEAFDHIIRLKPNYADAYFAKGQAQLKLQRYEDTLMSYNQAIILNPEKSSYYQAKAEAHDALARQAREKAQEFESPKSALKTA